ncbi:Ribosomal protein L49/IMG2 [Nannochloropsis gaditana]|uniref:Large ribosomal subunit protein mL49 n=1 Tax=Nannochloropsis gaditana TaxID=72520 RepID=W7U6S8_9STRA|nr:Ribosomal protein L49/IMG2 [Nannochloropsis gaditana]
MERASPLLARFGGHLRKHSNRAKKRIFGSRTRYEDVIRPAREQAAAEPPAPLKYPPTYQPSRVLPNGWSAPPDPATVGLPKTSLPFQVERTDKGRWLPVYTDVRKGRTQLITLVRKVSGDLEEMRGEMSKVCANQEVRIRTGPRLEVKGRYTAQLRQWLAGLGF